jgi:hypothetical protein
MVLTPGNPMRLLALLILPSLACAAPPPDQADQPAIELKLSAHNQNELAITIQNNGQQPLELPYRVTPLEHFVIELQGEQGKQHQIEHSGQQAGKPADQAKPGTLTIPAGKSETLSIHTCHYLPALGEGEQKVTFIVRLKTDQLKTDQLKHGQPLASKPLTVNP